MRRHLIALAATTAFGAAALAATPAPANPVLLVPWLVAAGAGGLVVGTAAHHEDVVVTPPPAPPPAAYEPSYDVQVAPPPIYQTCEIRLEYTAYGWRNVRVCV